MGSWCGSLPKVGVMQSYHVKVVCDMSCNYLYANKRGYEVTRRSSCNYLVTKGGALCI